MAISAFPPLRPRQPSGHGLWRDRRSSISANGKTIILSGWQENLVSVSRNGGLTWKSIDYPTLGLNILSILAADSCVFVGEMDSAVAVSCDGGATWKRTGSGNLSDNAYGMVHHRGAVIAAASSGLIRTLDNGKSWAPWAGNLEGKDGSVKITQSGGFLYAEVGDFTTIHYRSQDGGISWTPLTTPISGGIIAGINGGATDIGGHLFAATSRGVMESPDTGRSWNNLPIGLRQAPILSLGVQKGKFVAYTDQGIFSSADLGVSWLLPLPGAANNPWTAFAGAGPLYAAGAQDGKVAVSTDSGATWNPSFSDPLPGPVFSLAILGEAIYAGTSSGLRRQSVRDSAWSGIPLPVLDKPRLLAAGKVSLLVGADAHIWELGGDGSFSDRTAGIQPFQVRDLWIVEERLYAATREGVLYQWNAADAAWARVQEITGFVYSIAGAGPYMTAATSEGMYVLEENLKRWVLPQPDLLTDRGIRTVTCSGNRIYGGDANGGVWHHGLDNPGRACPDFRLPGGREVKASRP